MADLVELKEIEERVILVAVSTEEESLAAASLEELEELVETAGAVTVDKIIQNRERIHPGTYLGKGKIEEVKERVWELNATGIVCDDELSPRTASESGGCTGYEGDGPYHGNSRHFRFQGDNQGR